VLRLDDGRLIMATVVHLHNRLGRAYFAVVRRVHAAVVRAVLRRLGRVTAPR
jgi:hypothetical protein